MVEGLGRLQCSFRIRGANILLKRTIMKTKEKLLAVSNQLNAKCMEQFGFNMKTVTFNKIVDYMYAPKDPSSLALTRMFFGLAMLFDIPDERGGASMASLWGNPLMCHFPLLPIIQPIPMPYMALVYAAMWLGALGIMLGYKYRVTAPMFTVCYWYLFLIEKSIWNNHSYLFGLVASLLSCTEANSYWSLDTYLDPSKKKHTVPYWNYFILKYQFFILYFMAGIKKGTAEWLTGYSVRNLSEHWVFEPFKYFLTVPQTDHLVVHWFIFMFDLTVAVWMMWAYTRHAAMVFCALFHLMNSRLFSIGMFPWVCLATMPLFYPFDWPLKVEVFLSTYYKKIKLYVYEKMEEYKRKRVSNTVTYKKSQEKSDVIIEKADDNVTGKVPVETKYDEDVVSQTIEKKISNEQFELISNVKKTNNHGQGTVIDARKRKTIFLIVCYIFIQAFLPFSHFITKGYNNWTNGLYGYSWDMMVHSWDSCSIMVKIIDNESNDEMLIEPSVNTINDRWSRHGDMVYQYAFCLKDILEEHLEKTSDDSDKFLSKNFSITVDNWCGMNGRFIQRMYDPKVDLLKASWSPFTAVSFLMPLISASEDWRNALDYIRNEVHSWSNFSDVVFYADFPGYEQDIYLPLDFKNITLTILEGSVIYEPEVGENEIGRSYKLTTGDMMRVNNGMSHRVHNIGDNPAFYMYTFFNITELPTKLVLEKDVPQSKLPILSELYGRFFGMILFGYEVFSNILEIINFSLCYFGFGTLHEM